MSEVAQTSDNNVGTCPSPVGIRGNMCMMIVDTRDAQGNQFRNLISDCDQDGSQFCTAAVPKAGKGTT